MSYRRLIAYAVPSILLALAACSSSSDSGVVGSDAGSANDAATLDSGSGGDAGDSGGGSVDSGKSDGGVDAAPTGDFSCSGTPLPTTAPTTITLTGVAADLSVSGNTALSGVSITAYPTQTSTSALANTASDGSGNFSLTIGTGGAPVDGYLMATKTGELDTYLYPNAPLAKDSGNLATTMVTPTTFSGLSSLAGVTPNSADGFVAILVIDCGGTPVPGVVVTSVPAGTVRYNGGTGLPSSTATATAADGLAYVFNVTAGAVTLNASAGATALRSHGVQARAGAFTTTIVTP